MQDKINTGGPMQPFVINAIECRRAGGLGLVMLETDLQLESIRCLDRLAAVLGPCGLSFDDRRAIAMECAIQNSVELLKRGEFLKI
jgi:hypothetical protein